MQLTTATTLLLSLLATSSSSAFVAQRNAFYRPLSTTSSLSSTLAPDTPETRVHGDDHLPSGALSMQIDELAEILGGRGRAQIVWDCYSIVSLSNHPECRLTFPIQLQEQREWLHDRTTHFIFAFACTRVLNQLTFMEMPSN
jgi:hypothetical protein